MSRNEITGDNIASKALTEQGRMNFDRIFGVKMKNENPLEKQIEERVGTYAKSKGWLTLKFTSPMRAAVPDRIYITPFGRIIFVEFKRKGMKPTPAQQREHERLIHQGCTVRVIDNVEAGIALVDADWGM